MELIITCLQVVHTVLFSVLFLPDGHRQLVQFVPEERAGDAHVGPAQLLRGPSAPLHPGTFLRAAPAL